MNVEPMLRLLETALWRSRAISGQRVKTLFWALADAGPRGLSNAALIEAIWSDTHPTHPAKALQLVVSRARNQTSAETIERTEYGYRLALAETDVDMWLLPKLVAEAKTALEAEDFSNAVEVANQALTLADDQQARRVLGLGLFRQGKHQQALPALSAALESTPYDEALAAEYLRCLAATQGTAAALDQYATIYESLRDSLGSTPGPQLAGVHRQLLAIDQPVRSGLRFSATSLVGRNDDITNITQQLASARLVSIVGAGGLGKTRLAQEVAQTISDAHVHVVELAAIRQAEDVIVAVAEALQVSEPASRKDRHVHYRNLRSRLLAQLASGPHIIVLDNCEHLIESVASLVNDLLTAVADLRILTTSRTPLRLTAEHTYALEQLTTQDAKNLFCERALAARPDIKLADDALNTLVEHLDGLPLAIELAAAQARTHTVEGIIEKLTDRFQLLQGNDRTVPRRHQTLQAVIDWSWQLLNQKSQQALMTMSLLPDSFTLSCAEDILGPGAAVAVENLVDQSLLSVIEPAGYLRFRMLETIREYGSLKLQTGDLTVDATHAVEDWAFRTCQAVAPEILGTNQLRPVATVRAEESNLTYILRQFLERTDDRAVAMLAALLPYWMVTGAHLNIVTHFEPIEAFFATWQVTAEYRAAARQSLAVVATTWGMLPRWTQLPNSLGLLAQLGSDAADPWVQGLARMGITIVEQPDVGPLWDNTSHAEALVQSEDRYTSLLTIPFLAGVRENAGDLDGAISQLEQAVRTLHEHDPPWLTVRYRELLSQLHLQTGSFRKAQDNAERALTKLTGLGDTTQCRAVLACSYLNLGQLDEAETLLQELVSLDHADDASGPHYLLTIGLAEVALAKGSIEYGLSLLEQTRSYDRRRVPVPGMPTDDGLDPWNLMKYAIITAAYAQHSTGNHTKLFQTLLHRAVGATAQHRKHYDFPVLGTVAYGLASWGIFQDALEFDDVITLAALAQRLQYNRAFPCLNWQRLQAGLSEPHRVRINRQIEDLEALSQADVITRYHQRVTAIASADTI